MPFTIPKWITLTALLLSTFLIVSCSQKQTIEKPLQITSCVELSEGIKYFQQNCKKDSDCIHVNDPITFCYSEVVHRDRKNEYETLFTSFNCPNDKPGQNNR